MNWKINSSWKKILTTEFKKNYFKNLEKFLSKEYQQKNIFPAWENIFQAFNKTKYSNLKIILIGQDPYHTAGMATGLAFSIPMGQKLPPSLKNIYQEIETDLKIKKNFIDGNLEGWAEQGVLLLNQVLTVEEGKPGSHWNLGWEKFTANLIQKISAEKENLVFLLWGANAQKVEKYIFQPEKHLILKSAHPSPLSAYRGFFGCRHFSQANQFLVKNKIKKIDW